jgi:ankyrin repeat protein
MSLHTTTLERISSLVWTHLLFVFRPTMISFLAGSYEVCRYLLQQAGERRTELANLAAISGYGSSQTSTTPIMWASWAGNLPIVELLVLHGGEPLAKDSKTNQTALHWASAAGHVQVCQYLLSAAVLGSDENNKSSRSETKIQQEVVEGFLQAIDAPDGNTPLDYARMNGHQELVEWIMKQCLASYLVPSEEERSVPTTPTFFSISKSMEDERKDDDNRLWA